MRAGTENVAAIVSFAKALSVVAETLKSSVETMRRLRDHFEASLFAKLRDVEINGYGQRVCNTSNLRFSGIDGEALLIKLDLLGVSVSHGSACASSALEPSRVLLSMGLTRAEAGSSLRFSLSRNTTKNEIDAAVDLIISCVLEQRRITANL